MAQFGTFTQSFGKHGFSKEISVNLDLLPNASFEFLLRYGLKQKLADCYAGAKTAAEVEAALATTLQKLREGTLSVRTRSGGDAVEREMRKVASERVDAALRVKGRTADKEQRADLVAQVMEKYRDELRAEAERRLGAVADIDLDDLDL